MLGWLVEQAHQWAHAFVTLNLAGLYGNWLTIVGLSLALAAWALAGGLRLSAGIRRFRRAIAGAQAEIDATPDKAGDFTTRYEAANEALRQQPLIGPAWRDWAATLITPSGAGQPVRATVRPEEYLSLDLLRDCGINPRLHAAMPNLLVGVGLLLTFAGLSLALGAAGGIVGADKVMRESGLRDLLGTASAKFILSLVGLLCSIVYASCRSGALGEAERLLGRLLAALEERIPLATPATLQNEANARLQDLADGMSAFSNQLAVAIGEQMNTAFDQRLGEHIGPLREAIDKLAGGIGTRSEDTVREMLEQFLAGLRGGSDTAMREVAGALGSLVASMEQTRDGMAGAAQQMAAAAGQITERMAAGADAAMAGMSEQMQALAAELRDLAGQARDSGQKAVQQAADEIAAAARTFAASSERVAGALSGGANDAASRMTEAMEAMKRQLSDLTGELAASLRAVGADVTGSSRSGAETLSAAAIAAANSLRDGGAAAAHDLGAASEVLAASARDNAERIVTLQREAAALAETLTGMRAALADAAGPLRSVAGGFAETADSVGRTTAALAETGRQMVPASQAVATAATRLTEAEQSARELAAGLASAVARFNGMDTALAGVVTSLSEGLNQFAETTTAFVKETNKDMAHAATALNGSVGGLTDALDALGENIASLQRR